MDEVKKIEHYKNLNTDTAENSAADLGSFLKKNKKNKEMSEIVAGSILQLLRQTQDSHFPILEKKNGQMKSIDNKSSLQVDRNSSFSLQTNGIEQLSTKKVLNMTSRDQGVNSELSDKTIQFKGGIHNGIHTEKFTVQNHSNNKEREKKYRDGDKKNGEQAHLLDITNERRFADNKTMFTQHIEKQRNVHTLNQNDINNSVNSANVPENELTYQFQRWGQNHTVRILESSEGIRLKPSDTIVSDRLHEAQHNDVTAQRWVLTEHDERQGQRHQTHDEQENEGKFENDQKDES
ncbi:type III secretion protein [Escherichia coli]|nr:type III secretion protein [Escherichia coli]EHQ5526498.1 type III secretion protein [Escherichia coli O2]BDI42705.1 type III secretion protein [Escherichia sp. HH091_1A]EHT0615332.1 type III secretion protein [Escherichia coli]EIG8383252.1 type III secretion protein [Escherichia coli]